MTGRAEAARPALPQAFFLPAPEGGQRFCLFYPPPASAPPLGRVLYCPPFAEELNTTRRAVAQQARTLAEAGFAVLQIDLVGCGDSSGGFEDASWPAWLADLRMAHAWLSQRTSGPLWLWGLRAGALLASDLAARLPEPAHLLLWQPAASGQQQLQQLLRLHTAGQWLAGNASAPVKKTDTPAQQLAQGQPVHIAGYPLSPGLAQGLATARLQPPPNQPPGRIVWLEFTQHAAPLSTGTTSPATEKALAAWRAAGWQATARTVASPAFWQTVEAEAAPETEIATREALLAEPIEGTDTTSIGTAAIRPQPGQPSTPISQISPP